MTSDAIAALFADTQNSRETLSSAYAGGTIVSASNVAITEPVTASTLVVLGSNDTITDNAASLMVAQVGSNDTVITSALQVGDVIVGKNDTLTELSSGAHIWVDPTQAIAPGTIGTINASNDTITFQSLSSVLTIANSGHGCGGGGGQGSVVSYLAEVDVVGDSNLIQTGNVTSLLRVIGHNNIVTGGCYNTTVTLTDAAAAYNLVIGGYGTMTVNSTAAATKIIGGSGTLCATIAADSASIVGGTGDLYASIKGSGADVQTGSGTSQVDFTGTGGAFATGSGNSTITTHGNGAFFYEADSRGTAIFNQTGDGAKIFGGDCVTTCGNGNIVYTRGQAATQLVPGTLKTLFTSGVSGFLPNAIVSAALAATGDSILPDGIVANSGGSGGGGGCGGGNNNGCGSSSARVIHFNGNSGSVYTGDRITYVYVNGNYDSVYTGATAQYVGFQSGTGNVLFAGQGGGNSYYDGGTGVNTLDYQDAKGVIVDLRQGLARNGLGGIDTVRNFTHVSAGAGSILVAGNSGVVFDVHGAGAQLIGGAGNDTLISEDSGASFTTGLGNDTVSSGGAGSTYTVNAASTGTTSIDQSSLGITGTLSFTAVSQPQQLWFQQDAANDLVVTVLGTHEVVTFAHWFATDASSTQLAKIGTTGGYLDTAGVNAVEQTMASYEAAHPGFNPSASSTLPNDPSIKSAFALYAHAA